MGAGPGRSKLSPEELKNGFASFYYDLTASTSAAQLYALQQLVPVPPSPQLPGRQRRCR